MSKCRLGVPVLFKRRFGLGMILDARCWMLVMPVLFKRRFGLGMMLDTRCSMLA
ncbi:MAG: hypothetical protein QGF00_22845 [Planctomycetota bacterium]|nr:hypothetical protein [Planctomycetota bacterium]